MAAAGSWCRRRCGVWASSTCTAWSSRWCWTATSPPWTPPTRRIPRASIWPSSWRTRWAPTPTVTAWASWCATTPVSSSPSPATRPACCCWIISSARCAVPGRCRRSRCSSSPSSPPTWPARWRNPTASPATTPSPASSSWRRRRASWSLPGRARSSCPTRRATAICWATMSATRMPSPPPCSSRRWRAGTPPRA